MESGETITSRISSFASSDIVSLDTTVTLASLEPTSHAGDSTESVQRSSSPNSATSSTYDATASGISPASGAISPEATLPKGASGASPSLLVTLSVPTALAGIVVTLFAVGAWTCYRKRKQRRTVAAPKIIDHKVEPSDLPSDGPSMKSLRHLDQILRYGIHSSQETAELCADRSPAELPVAVAELPSTPSELPGDTPSCPSTPIQTMQGRRFPTTGLL